MVEISDLQTAALEPGLGSRDRRAWSTGEKMEVSKLIITRSLNNGPRGKGPLPKRGKQGEKTGKAGLNSC